MVINLCLLFIFSSFFALVEGRIAKKEKILLYCIMGVVMILIAGFRDIGSTPDTEAYEDMYLGLYSDILEDITEPSFTLISSALKFFSFSVTSLFLVYAFISVFVHLTVFWKISNLPLMTLLIYLSYYYMMHDLVQIRAGVASALFLWSLYFYVERKKWYSLAFILLGTFFHYSGIVGLTIFLLTDRIEKWHKYVLYSLVPIGLVAYFIGLDLSFLVPEYMGGDKLVFYRDMKDSGLENDLAGWPIQVNVSIWMNIVLFYACIYYHDFLKPDCKYLTIAIKVQAIGFCCLFFLHGVSAVLGNRLNDYFSVASILLWTYSVRGFVPIIAGKIVNILICAIRFVLSMLFYALSLLFM